MRIWAQENMVVVLQGTPKGTTLFVYPDELFDGLAWNIFVIVNGAPVADSRNVEEWPIIESILPQPEWPGNPEASYTLAQAMREIMRQEETLTLF